MSLGRRGALLAIVLAGSLWWTPVLRADEGVPTQIIGDRPRFSWQNVAVDSYSKEAVLCPDGPASFFRVSRCT
jgi:hypothetical protein